MQRTTSCFHDDSYVKGESKVKTNEESPAQHSETEPTPALSLNVTSQGPSANTSVIVPVWVSSDKNSSREKLVYALLVTQSDTTFIEQDVSNELQLNTYPVKLKLTTMSGENMVMKSERASGLRGFNSTVHINLPPAYTKNCIPVNREHIPKHEMAKAWRHLMAIAD